MALFDEVPEPTVTPPPVTVDKPRIEPEVFRGIAVDTQYVPSSSLLTWVEGSNWTVEYFSQALDLHSEPKPLSVNTGAIYQQYRRIRNMELKVTTPISFQPDDVTRTMEVRGSGITYPFLVPNKGDMFIGDVGDGRLGLFTITMATRATILKDSLYTIDFIMQTELNKDLLTNLEEKTIEEYHFSRDSLRRGCGPFITRPEFNRHERYSRLRQELIDRYLVDFYSRQHSTLLVPDQLRTTYDHFLVKAVLEMIGSQENPTVRRIREMNVTAEPVMEQPSIWDAVIRRSPYHLNGSTQRIHTLLTTYFRGRPTLQAIGVTGITRLVFPMDAPTDVDAYHNGRAFRNTVGFALDEGRPRRHISGTPLTQATRNLIWFQPTELTDSTTAWQLPPDIHPVTRDDYYVLSQAFYDNDTTAMSKLELLTGNALNSRNINYDQLDALLEYIWEWDNLERFYYYPLVWVLLTIGMYN